MIKIAPKLLLAAALLGTALTSHAGLFSVTQHADLTGLDTGSRPNRVDLFDLDITGLTQPALSDGTLELTIEGDFNSGCFLSFLGFGGSTNGECLYGTLEGFAGEFRLTDGSNADNGPFDGGSAGNDVYTAGQPSTYTAIIGQSLLNSVIADGVLSMSFDRGGNVNGVSQFFATLSYDVADVPAPSPALLTLLAGLLAFAGALQRGSLRG